MGLRLVFPRAFRWPDEQIAQILLGFGQEPRFRRMRVVRLVPSILWMSGRLDSDWRFCWMGKRQPNRQRRLEGFSQELADTMVG